MSLLLFVKILKLLAEVALMALAGRALLGLLAGPGRDSNFFWQLLNAMVAPLERGLARLHPVAGRTASLALLLLLAWGLATTAKLMLCLGGPGLAACRV